MGIISLCVKTSNHCDVHLKKQDIVCQLYFNKKMGLYCICCFTVGFFYLTYSYLSMSLKIFLYQGFSLSFVFGAHFQVLSFSAACLKEFKKL